MTPHHDLVDVLLVCVLDDDGDRFADLDGRRDAEVGVRIRDVGLDVLEEVLGLFALAVVPLLGETRIEAWAL